MRERDYPPATQDRQTQHTLWALVRSALPYIATVAVMLCTWFLGSMWTTSQQTASDVRHINDVLNERVIRQIDAETARNDKQDDTLDSLKSRVDRIEAVTKVP